MENSRERPPAEVLWAAAAPPRRQPSRGEESEARPAALVEPDGAAGSMEGRGGPRRALGAVYVSNSCGTAGGYEVGAFRCLARACEAEGVRLSTVPFGELDSGDKAVLDVFYRAGEAGAPFAPVQLPPALLTRTHAILAPAQTSDGNARPFGGGGESR